MAIRAIVTYPDEVLRKRTDPVGEFGRALNRLIDDMTETMYAAPGVGLAANQVGISQQVAVIDVSERDEKKRKGRELLVIVNPEILAQEGSVLEEEGCLSIPGYADKVTRAVRVKVRAQDRTGKPFELEAEGLLAKALQHEIDHLNGMLFVDRLSPLKKNIFRRRFKKMSPQKA